MSDSGLDGRRSRRVAPDDCYLRLVIRVPVVVRDIGLGGVQVESSVSLPMHCSAQLQTMLHGWSFLPDVQIPWAAGVQAPDSASWRLGINFRSMSDDSQKALSNFLVTAPDPDA